MAKYEALRRRVETECPAVRLFEPPAARDEELAQAHGQAYLRRVFDGELSSAEQRAIGFPWSPQMVERSRRSVGATISACRCAMQEGIAVNLAGGTHHAHTDSGQGYCVFNDAAVASRVLQSECRATQRPCIAIVDLDVHQGNGTAAIFRGDPSVFTLSLHGASNFPFRKECSDLDVALPDGTGDHAYLAALDRALGEMLRRFEPTFLIYLAGADAHECDRLGRLALTTAGLRARDRRVFELAFDLRLPIAVTMAGGYGRDLAVTVDVHLNTVSEALRHFERLRGGGTIGIAA